MYGFYAFTGQAENISFFFIEIENFRGEGTHDTTFSEKNLDFYKILEESEQFFILFLKKMESLRRFFSIFEVRGEKFFWNVVWLKYDPFFIAKLIICLVWIKKNCLVNSKVKELFMCFYVIFMNKHVGITLSVFLLVLYTGARGTEHPPPLFLTFCLQTYFQ